jgi:oligogalacturonide lyase
MKKSILSLIVISLLLAFTQHTKPTLYIIGDSTVKNGSGKGSDGQWGWGSLIYEHFDTTKIRIENHAIGGRSSRTFLTEGRWERILKNLKPGDYVMMQFGHNDGGAINDTTRARGSIRGIGDETQEIDNLLTKKQEIVHSFGWYMKKYINETKEKGAVPIVFSPVPRNVWKEGKIPRDTYGKWAAECAAITNAFFIDINESIAKKYEQSNEAQLKADFFPIDHTHTNFAGAKLNAEMVVIGLRSKKDITLNQFLLTEKQIKKKAKEIPTIETGSVFPMPKTWIDQSTGHKIVRISSVSGENHSFYFHNNPFITSSGGDLMAFYNTTKEGKLLYSVNLKTLENTPLLDKRGAIGGEILATKRKELFFQRKDSVFATSIISKQTRLIYVFPKDFRGSISTVNADENILAGVCKDGDKEREILRQFPEKKDYFDRIFDAKILNTLFTINIDTGELNKIHAENTWIGHIQFVPTNPNMLMFCHEGPWHKLDRMWTIDIKTKETKLMHKRTMDMEIAGHEFPSWDGKTIWFDLQMPKGKTFFLAGTNIETGEEKRYEMTRNEWSIHFNISPDQRLFAGDGGDAGQVAKAPDGRWIYLFTPEGNRLKSEKLVNMQHQNYKLEPNVHFSPDGKWIIFRANFEGQSQIYAVEVKKVK